MNNKTLKMNRFGESIMSEYSLYNSEFDGPAVLAYPRIKEKSNIMKIRFLWSWNGYSGQGELYYYNDSYILCNEFGENFSHMTVSSNSQRKQPNDRDDCALYNDPTLVPLFNDMLLKLKRHMLGSN